MKSKLNPITLGEIVENLSKIRFVAEVKGRNHYVTGTNAIASIQNNEGPIELLSVAGVPVFGCHTGPFLPDRLSLAEKIVEAVAKIDREPDVVRADLGIAARPALIEEKDPSTPVIPGRREVYVESRFVFAVEGKPDRHIRARGLFLTPAAADDSFAAARIISEHFKEHLLDLAEAGVLGRILKGEDLQVVLKGERS